MQKIIMNEKNLHNTNKCNDWSTYTTLPQTYPETKG